MAYEKEDYRDNLGRIWERFQKECITVNEAVEYLGIGIKNLNNDKSFPKIKIGGRYYVTAVALAKWLSKDGKRA